MNVVVRKGIYNQLFVNSAYDVVGQFRESIDFFPSKVGFQAGVFLHQAENYIYADGNYYYDYYKGSVKASVSEQLGVIPLLFFRTELLRFYFFNISLLGLVCVFFHLITTPSSSFNELGRDKQAGRGDGYIINYGGKAQYAAGEFGKAAEESQRAQSVS